VDAEKSRDSLKFEYAGGVGAVVVNGSSSGSVPKFNAFDDTPSSVVFGTSSVVLPEWRHVGGLSVASAGLRGVVGGGMVVVLALLVVVARSLSVAVQDGGGLV
jgi:hypothetical protein